MSIKTFKCTVSTLFLFVGIAGGLAALDSMDYRTGTPDPLIKKMPSSVSSFRSKGAEAYLKKVAEYIDENAENEFDKVKKIHDWVALNIRYNTSAFFSGKIPSQTVTNVVSSGLAVCAGYSEVFYYLCGLLDVECETITGYGRGYGRSVFGVENPNKANHAWNKVRIDNNWYLIDTTWDSGIVSGRDFLPHYKTIYLFTPPEEFIYDHFPYSQEDQLLPVPMPAEEFIKLPILEPEFFIYVADLAPAMQKIMKINGRFFRMEFTSPVQHHFMFNLFASDGGKHNSLLTIRKRDGKWILTYHFQKPGNYRVSFYSSPNETGTHAGIGEFGFNVEIPNVKWGELPGNAELIFPETQGLLNNTLVEFKINPGKWKYLVLINSGNWQFLSPNEENIHVINYKTPGTGAVYLAASETECGAYETLAVFNVR